MRVRLRWEVWSTHGQLRLSLFLLLRLLLFIPQVSWETTISKCISSHKLCELLSDVRNMIRSELRVQLLQIYIPCHLCKGTIFENPQIYFLDNELEFADQLSSNDPWAPAPTASAMAFPSAVPTAASTVDPFSVWDSPTTHQAPITNTVNNDFNNVGPNFIQWQSNNNTLAASPNDLWHERILWYEHERNFTENTGELLGREQESSEFGRSVGNIF